MCTRSPEPDDDDDGEIDERKKLKAFLMKL